MKESHNFLSEKQQEKLLQPKTCKELLVEFKKKKIIEGNQVKFEGVEEEMIVNVTAPFLDDGKSYMAGQVEKKEVFIIGNKVKFEGVEEKDVYNIIAPFVIGGNRYIAGRVEPHENTDAHTVFFIEKDGVWQPDTTLPIFPLEDPFISHIKGEVVFGGVKINPINDEEGKPTIEYRTVLYKGKNLETLQPFATGPEGMKDIRLIKLPDGKIGVFTRPQGEIGGKGKIGFIKVDSLDQINPDLLLHAPLLEGQFIDEEWGGANELHLLEDGTIGVLAHIAYQEKEEKKHYYVTSFEFNPDTLLFSPMKIIATRENFPAGKKKDGVADLGDVVFPGGLTINPDNTVTVYVGLSDAEAGSITIPNPFSKKFYSRSL